MEEELTLNEEQELAKTRTCSCCGRVIEEGEDYQEYDGEIYCQDCFDEEFTYCEDCGETIRRDDATWIDGGEYYVCDSCLNHNYTYCDDCNNWVSNDDITLVANGDCVCQECLSNNYYYCDRCDEYVYYTGWNSEHDCCENCVQDCENRVCDYHDSDKSFKKYDNGENPKWYIGYELETGNKDTSGFEPEITEHLRSKLNVQFERDGSICATSDVEIISNPQSLAYIYGKKDEMTECFNFMTEHGYRSHDLGTCGLHFHFSRLKDLDNDEVVARGWLILETFKDQIMKISGRKSDDTHYFKWLSDKINNYGKSIKAISTLKKNGETTSTRYLAINNTNSETIEFRFNRGTLVYDTFMARLEFTNNLYEIMTNLDKNIEEYTWQDLIKGEYIKKYVQELGLENVDIAIKDYSIEIIQEANEMRTKIKKAIRIFTAETKNRIKEIGELAAANKLILKDFQAMVDRVRVLSSNATFYKYTVENLNVLLVRENLLNEEDVKRCIRNCDYDNLEIKKKVYKIFGMNI